MLTRTEQPQQALCAEILAQARTQSQEMIHRARQDADALLARAAADAEKTRAAKLDLASAEAARRRELLLAAVPVQTGRLRSAQLEGLLQSIYQAARQRLIAREGFDYKETVITLAADAIRRMSSPEIVIKLSPADRAAFGQGLAEQIVLRVARPSLRVTVSEDQMIAEGGLIVEDAGGHEVWDNRLPTRLDRLWPELRRQLAFKIAPALSIETAGDGL